MKNSIYIFSICCFSAVLNAQTIVKGSVNNNETLSPLQGVLIEIENTRIATKTNTKGFFELSEHLPLGEQVLKVSLQGFISKRFPIIIYNNKTIDLSSLLLKQRPTAVDDIFTIALTDDELDNDANGLGNISGLLASSLDVFQRTAAFEFSASFFKVRGLNSNYSTVLINGIKMNKLYNGRPQWSNWGGINDALRHQELTTGLEPSMYNFGSILGSVNINTSAFNMRPGVRLTYSSSNRSYTHRLMATYASGAQKKGWAYVFTLGRRWGQSGYQNATIYDANSLFTSVDKKIGTKHRLSFTGIYAPNRRGKSSPNTQEVFNLKGLKYNAYWGYQNGKVRNSRIKKVNEPIVMLNHYWNFNSTASLNTNIAYQFGTFTNSRLTYGGANLIRGLDGQVSYERGGANPSPSYYQNLPSYFERNFPDNLGFAYQAQQEFLNNGQIDWNRIYSANRINSGLNRNASYILSQDRVDDKQWSVNSFYQKNINSHVLFNTAVNFKSLISENYAQVNDLLGGSGFLNVDSFNGTQYDLNNPNQILKEGDVYSYHYNMLANTFSSYAQLQFNYNTFNFYTALDVTGTNYQRQGVFQNESFLNNSSGKGEKVSFLGLGLKTGLTYKVTGKHILNTNAAYIKQAPNIRNTYSNPRYNHNIVPQISEEEIVSIDASYIYRTSILQAKLTGFYTRVNNANEISFFFANGIGQVITASGTQTSSNDNAEFVQEILKGVNKNYIGSELGIDAQVTPTVKLKAVAAYGIYTYANNPELYISSDRFENVSLGPSYLKNYKLSVGPHQAYSVGVEYRDPNYWWVGATLNFFNNTYVDISPLSRTSNFYKDNDGFPFLDYNVATAKSLLKQEVFKPYHTVNLTAGKSWLVNKHYVALFLSVNNALNAVYKTGGFEQGRNANFRQLRDDKALNKPIFGSKYWYGRGATYFVNLNVRL